MAAVVPIGYQYWMESQYIKYRDLLRETYDDFVKRGKQEMHKMSLAYKNELDEDIRLQELWDGNTDASTRLFVNLYILRKNNIACCFTRSVRAP